LDLTRSELLYNLATSGDPSRIHGQADNPRLSYWWLNKFSSPFYWGKFCPG